jgi:hypothetical protein
MGKVSKLSISTEEVAEARRRFEAGEPLNAIARTMGVHRTTLNRIREREEWSSPTPVTDLSRYRSTLSRKAQSTALALGAAKAVEEMKADGTLALVKDRTKALIDEQGQIAEIASRHTRATLEALERGCLTPEAAMIYKMILGSAPASMEAVRTALGIKPGQATVQAGPVDTQKVLSTRRMEPRIIDVNPDGREVKEAS